jgi:secreted PhoX family phosphatase
MAESLDQSRRDFIKFMGHAGMLAGSASLVGSTVFPRTALAANMPFEPLRPSYKDDLVLAKGFKSQVILKWEDTINKIGEQFGFNSDFTAFIPLTPGQNDDGLLWVNHEYPNPLFVSGYYFKQELPKTKAQVIQEQESVGGSIVRIQKRNGKWKIKKDDPMNRRITARTPIPLVSDRKIAGSKTAIGTFENCGGGVTPWRTILTCEENYQFHYGEVEFSEKGKRRVKYSPIDYRWHKHFDYPPEHYGWVVEVNPFTGEAKKLTALGRFSHEAATVVTAKDERAVVYMGDDKELQCIYKFISNKHNSLDSGKLYVADFTKGKWVSLQRAEQTVLLNKFKDQTEVLIRCREAAKLVGGTPMDRPEDIEVDPKTGAVYVSLTKSKIRNNNFGSLLKIVEDKNDPLSLSFKSSTFVSGGPTTGFSNPDNLAFDKNGNLWMTSDMSGTSIGVEPYVRFGNNGLFYIPMHGKHAGKVFQVASAPRDAELTGPSFSPDGKTLFLSVQHPGELSKTSLKPTSRWPDGGDSYPRPSVVAISGPALEKLTK